MKPLLIFPPGWMQFGPFLSLPLLKGYLSQQGIEVDILDLNIEFYDWILSRHYLEQTLDPLRNREKLQDLTEMEYAKVCRGLLDYDHVITHVSKAKNVLRNSRLYLDDTQREWARRIIGDALNIIESSFDHFHLSLNQMHFGQCGLHPEKESTFLKSEQNIIFSFYLQHVRKLIKSGCYDFIGFSLPAYEQLIPTLTLVNAIKLDMGQEVHICLGGNYVTRMIKSRKDIAHPFSQLIDSFVLFEGEESLCQLLVALSDRQTLNTVPNLVYRDGNRLLENPIAMVNINTIPTPNFDGLPFDKYFSPEIILPIYTSRGCPSKCAFCTIPYASSKFRLRDPQKVVDDIERLQKKYDVGLFTFIDETMTISSLNQVSAEILKRNLNVRWYGETRFNSKINSRLTRQVFDSGCRKLQFGLESYNQRVLNLMNKGTNVEDILPNIESCLSSGIAVHLFTFVGFPGETEQEARTTYEFTRKVLRLSRDKYFNSYSSIGMGAFGLEVYSDVYYNPHRYGVIIRDNQETDNGEEIRELKYDVESGLTHEGAMKLVSEFQERERYKEACCIIGHVPWTETSSKETNEEEDFLLYALTGNSNRLTLVTLAPHVTTHRQMLSKSILRSITLTEGTVMQDFSRDFLSGNRDSSVTSVYRPDSHSVINLPRYIAEDMRWLLSQGYVNESIGSQTMSFYNSLLRNKMIDVQGEGICKEDACLDDYAEDRLILRSNPDFVLYRRDSGQFMAINTVTHHVLSINTLGAYLVRSVDDESLHSVRAFVAYAERDLSLSISLIKSTLMTIANSGLMSVYRIQ